VEDGREIKKILGKVHGERCMERCIKKKKTFFADFFAFSPNN